MVTSTNQPTDQPTDQPGEYRAICLFRKLENRKKAEICKNKRPLGKTKKKHEIGIKRLLKGRIENTDIHV